MNFRKHFERVLLCGALCLSASAAKAATISEIEGNDTSGTANPLAPALFTPNSDPNVFGTDPTATISGAIGAAGDIDFFSFMAFNGDRAFFDIDLTDINNGPDTFLSLFDAGGTLLAGGDDSPPADMGSVTDLDAFLGTFTFTTDGTFFIAVSQSGNVPNAFNDPNAIQSGLTRPDNQPSGGFAVSGVAPDQTFSNGMTGATGAYQLNVTLVPAPEPGTMSLMAIGLASLGAASRKRKKKTQDEATTIA